MTVECEPSGLIAVTGIGPVSRPAMGVAQLRTAVLAGDLGTWARPEHEDGSLYVREFDTFDPVAHLGKRGWKYLPEATRLALAATRLALLDAEIDPDAADPAIGVSVGTNFAVSEIVDRIDRGLLESGVSGISAIECPNFAVNLPASQVSIAYGLRAFNVTYVDLIVAGVQALRSGVRALHNRRANGVIAGAVEGRPPQGAEYACGPVVDSGASCMVYLERAETALQRGARAYGWISSGLERFLTGERERERDRGTLDDVARWIHGVDPGSVRIRRPDSECGRAVQSELLALMSDHDVQSHVDLTTSAPQASASAVLGLAQDLLDCEGDDERISVTIGPLGHLVALHYIGASGSPIRDLEKE